MTSLFSISLLYNWITYHSQLCRRGLSLQALNHTIYFFTHLTLCGSLLRPTQRQVGENDLHMYATILIAYANLADSMSIFPSNFPVWRTNKTDKNCSFLKVKRCHHRFIIAQTIFLIKVIRSLCILYLFIKSCLIYYLTIGRFIMFSIFIFFIQSVRIWPLIYTCCP